MQLLQGMAVGTNLRIDLEASLQGGEIKRAEGALEAPILMRHRVFLCHRTGKRQAGEENPRGNRASDRHAGKQGTQRAHQAFSIGLAVAPDGRGPPPPPRPPITG